MCLLTMCLFMGQVGWVCGRHFGQGPQPEKPLEEQGWWGRGSQWVPCRLLVVSGSRDKGRPHPRAESKLRGLLGMLVIQLLSHAQLLVTPWVAARQAPLSFTVTRSLLRLMSIESVMSSNHLILSSPSPPAFSLSQHQGLFQRVSSSHQVAKVLELQLQHQSF